MSNEKQSSVDWLYNELFTKQIDGFSEREWGIIDKAFEQAKEMEKKHIVKAAYEFMGTNFDSNMGRAEKYYNETYGGGEQ